MNEQKAQAGVKTVAKAWTLSLGIMFGLLGSAAWAAMPQSVKAQAGDPMRVATAFIEAINNRDAEAMRALATEDFMILANQGTRFASQQSLEQYVAAVQGEQTGLKVLDIKADGQSVVASVEFTGSPILARLPNPATATITFTVRDERIARMDVVFSEQTLRDLEALLGQLQPTAQPTTQPTTQPTPEATPEPQPKDNVSLVLEFIKALNEGDLDAAQSLATEDFTIIFDDTPGTVYYASLEEFVGLFKQFPDLTLEMDIERSEPDVYGSLIFTGHPDIDSLNYQFTYRGGFSIRGGRISLVGLTLHPGTRQELADLQSPFSLGSFIGQPAEVAEEGDAQPGMPKTGNSLLDGTSMVTLLGLFSVAWGVVIKRRAQKMYAH